MWSKLGHGKAQADPLNENYYCNCLPLTWKKNWIWYPLLNLLFLLSPGRWLLVAIKWLFCDICTTVTTAIKLLIHAFAMLTELLTTLESSQKELISCIIHTTNTRVSAQRLSYRLDSDTFHHYNNSNSREELKLSRINVQNWIRNIHQQILALSTATPASLQPSSPEYGEVGLLCQNVSEIILLLEQVRKDLKETCNDYCAFITGQYQSINKYILPADIKLFISYPEKPFLLPKLDNSRPATEANELQNPIIKTIVTEILYRRQDLHLILDTLRLIDIVSPSVKLIERELSVKLTCMSRTSSRSSLFQKYSGAINGNSSDSSDDSDEEQDLILSTSGGYPKRSLYQRIKNVFLGSSNSKRIGSSSGSYQKTATSDEDDEADEDGLRDDSDEEEEKLMGGLEVQLRPAELRARKKRMLLIIWAVIMLLIFITLIGVMCY